MVLATVLCHSVHCLRLGDKLSILTDKLCSYLKVQTVSKRQVLGNAVFVNDLLTSLLRYSLLKALFLCRSLLKTDAERGDSALGVRPRARGPGQYWRHPPNEWKLRFFSKKSLGSSVCTRYGKKIHQKGLKVAKYSAKVALVMRELMAQGGWHWGNLPQINERMGNTGDFLWECRLFSSTQNYETHWAREDFPTVNRLRMVSFSRVDKKSVRG